MARRAKKSEGNDKKARLSAAWDKFDDEHLDILARKATYLCHDKHKGRAPSRGVPPHLETSTCDEIRRIRHAEADMLIKSGIRARMMSELQRQYGWPKYIWAVDDDGEVYEAKESRNHPGEYHGYRLNEDHERRNHMLGHWKKKCPKT